MQKNKFGSLLKFEGIKILQKIFPNFGNSNYFCSPFYY
jgi:hypothetical protein